MGNRTQTEYPGGQVVTYTHDDAGRLVEVRDWAGGLTTYTYDDAGRLLSTQAPNGVGSAYAYDAAGRLSQIEHTKAGDWLTRYDYGLDPAGNRIAITETTTAVRTLYMPALGRPAPGAGGEGATAPPYGQAIRYSYDELDRLTAASHTNGDRYGLAYDPVGNRVAYTVTAQSLVTETTSYTPAGSFGYDAADRLTSVNGTPHTYDNRGNLLSDGTWTYVYNAAGRMVRATSISATRVYTYNTLEPGTLDPARFQALVAALGDDWQGTVRVTCSNGQPLAGVGLSRLPSVAPDRLAHSAPRGSVATAGALVFPDVYRRLTGGADEQWSAALVHNTTAVAGSVSVEFYAASGAKVGDTYVVAVGASGTVRLDLKDGADLPSAALLALGSGFRGSMYVRLSEGVVVVGVGRLFWSGEGRAAGYVGVAAP